MLFTPCSDVFSRLEVLGEGLPGHLPGMWLFLHRFIMNFRKMMRISDMDSSSGSGILYLGGLLLP